MGKLVQVRDVPEAVHRKLKARAAEQGTSLSEYLRAELVRLAALPTPEEFFARLQSRSRVITSERPEDIIRRMRDSA